MEKYNKIKLYKENIIKFIDTQNYKIIKINKLYDIDFLVGILFLTEMNRYCKQNKITIHGYYIAYSLINLFRKIRRKLVENYKITYNDINFLWTSLALNIDYLNTRVEDSNIVKNKINFNFCKIIIEINTVLSNFITYSKVHNCCTENSKKNTETFNDISNQTNQNNISLSNSISSSISDLNIYCDNKCYICWVDNILSKFFYLLLMLAKFIGSGETKEDPNLLKLSEYYANIFYTFLKINDIGKNNLNQNTSYEFFDNYIDYKNKLNYSLIELKLNSDTVDEIVNYLDDIIINNLTIK